MVWAPILGKGVDCSLYGKGTTDTHQHQAGGVKLVGCHDNLVNIFPNVIVVALCIALSDF